MNPLLNIPAHGRCINCGDCCGMIPATPEEIAEIRAFLNTHSDLFPFVQEQSHRPIICPFRDNSRQCCAIYPVRPLMCRLMGVVEGMNCKNGNSIWINGGKFLASYDMEHVAILNFLDWS